MRTQWKVWKGKKVWYWKMSSLGQKVSNMLLGKSRGQFLMTPERWRGWVKAEMMLGCGGTSGKVPVSGKWQVSGKPLCLLPAKAGDIRDMGLIPVSGRSPGEGHGNPLQYSCLENPMDRGAWRATVYRVPKSWTQLKWLSMHALVVKVKSNVVKKNIA